MSFAVSVYAAPPVDGFIGVPWGASREQVQTAMAEKGFALIGLNLDRGDTYKGNFAGYPAELYFEFLNNVFYKGSARLLDLRSPNYEAYFGLKGLISAKYMQVGREEKEKKCFQSLWLDLPAMATPAGKVSIFLTSGCDRSERAWIVYDITQAWARFKASGGSI